MYRNGDYRLFGPCDPNSGLAYKHEECAYYNQRTGEYCNCECHIPKPETTTSLPEPR